MFWKRKRPSEPEPEPIIYEYIVESSSGRMDKIMATSHHIWDGERDAGELALYYHGNTAAFYKKWLSFRRTQQIPDMKGEEI